MALYTVTTGSTINAADLNQLVNVLAQPSGGQEKGKYKVGGNGYSATAVIGSYTSSLSRVSTPVSVTIDTADQSPSGNLGSPSTTNLSTGGFFTFAAVSAGSVNAYCSGNYTIQY